MSEEATALENLPSKALWYILLGRKDLDDCTVALPWESATHAMFMRRLLRPGDSKEGAAPWAAVVLCDGSLYEVRVDVPNRNQHSKGGFSSAEAAKKYADSRLTRYGISLLKEKT